MNEWVIRFWMAGIHIQNNIVQHLSPKFG